MPFMVEDYHDLVRLLDEHPKWRAELRSLILTDDILELPHIVRELAEAQRRTEQRVEELFDAMRRVEDQIEKLWEVQSRTEEVLNQLVEAQHRTELNLAELALAQHKSEDILASLKGDVLELRYARRVGAYFGPLVRKAKAIELVSFDDVLTERLTRDEFRDLLSADLVVGGSVRGDPSFAEIFVAVEISSVVDRNDVERAMHRAELLRKAGFRAIPAVAGTRTTDGAIDAARSHSVMIMEDGRSFHWEAAVKAWTEG